MPTVSARSGSTQTAATSNIAEKTLLLFVLAATSLHVRRLGHGWNCGELRGLRDHVSSNIRDGARGNCDCTRTSSSSLCRSGLSSFGFNKYSDRLKPFGNNCTRIWKEAVQSRLAFACFCRPKRQCKLPRGSRPAATVKRPATRVVNLVPEARRVWHYPLVPLPWYMCRTKLVRRARIT